MGVHGVCQIEPSRTHGDGAGAIAFEPAGAGTAAWGAAGIPEYFSAWESESGRDPFEIIAQHEAALAAPLLEFLDAHPETTLIGPAHADAGTRLPIIAFRHATLASAHIARALAERHIAVKHGHFHSRRLLEFLGIPPDDGVVRVSFAHYNTRIEVTRLLEALREIFAEREKQE